MLRIQMIVAALVLAFTFPTAAADLPQAHYVWHNVTVGGGGFSPNIVFSRAERGLAYLRTDIGGLYRWDAAKNIWLPLQDAMAVSNYFGIESVAPDPADANVVYAAAGMYRWEGAAILRSKDRGTTWDVFPVLFRMGGNEAGRGLGERLAVDPNDTSILYFGSRDDGLQVSRDRGASWARVSSFPVSGRGTPARSQPPNGGIAFVVFDPASGTHGTPSKTIFAGVADPGEHHLFRSDDAGKSWHPVAGEPSAALLPVKAEIDGNGILYIAYCNGIGPNGITSGAVYKLDTHSGAWTDITPDKSPNPPLGGYMGLSLDRQHSGTLVVATLNRWQPGDTIWRTTDGGATWTSLREDSQRGVHATPFLLWGHPFAAFGWWMAGVAIDPFDSNHAAYTTGATVYATGNLSSAATTWQPWVKGVEETAVLTLISPPSGPQLLSGFGDVGGFTHDNFEQSPPMFTKPVFGNTNQIDFAGLAPNVVVRSGVREPGTQEGAATLAYSLDGGHTWLPLALPPLRSTNSGGEATLQRYDLKGDIAIVVSADGSAFLAGTPVALISRDRKTWQPVKGLAPWSRPVADRADAQRLYAVDFVNSAFYASTDGGANFAKVDMSGLPLNRADLPASPEAAWPLMATPDQAGDLWFHTHDGHIFHSADGGKTWSEQPTYMNIEALGFGKAPSGKDYPALFAFGWSGENRAIMRSDDAGKTWIRINDSDHEYGRRFRCISGDPRVFGRVYVGTDGRGIVYGEPAP